MSVNDGRDVASLHAHVWHAGVHAGMCEVLSEYCMLLIVCWLASLADNLVTEGEFLPGHMNLRCSDCGTVP